MAPSLVRPPFHRAGWVYEEKVDGWRMNGVPDAIVTDLQLPSEERGGVVLLEHVKRRFPVCAVLVLTGRADAYDELCGIGFDAVLLKPTSTTDLVAAVLAAV